jgi:hypothetical protein
MKQPLPLPLLGKSMEASPPKAVTIDNILVPALPQPSPLVKTFTKLEEDFFRVHAAGLQQDIEERKKYAHRIFVLICFWIGAVFLLLIAVGVGYHFALSNSVLLAVIGSTTVNVLGIFYIVTHYLFPKR